MSAVNRVAVRVAAAWRAMDGEQRLAAMAALGLFVSMFLPWYEKSYFERLPGASGLDGVSDGLSAFGAFSFVEAAVLLVAAAVLDLCFTRAEGKAFHLPGGDGTVILAGGAWAGLLLVWRLFDKPDASAPGGAAVTVGIQWGIFFALAAAGLVAYAGVRVRAAHRPEPPLPGEARRETRPTEPLVRDERPASAPAPAPAGVAPDAARRPPAPPPAAPPGAAPAPRPRTPSPVPPPPGEAPTVAMPGRRLGPAPKPDDPPEAPRLF